jgi:GNAT superfamily N-acetyltransferase
LLEKSKKWEIPVSPSGLSGKFDTELVTLSDPSIGYRRTINTHEPQFIKIKFYTLDSKEVGSVQFQFLADKEGRPILYINLLFTEGGERGKGYGKRILAAVMDIARRTEKHKVSLSSFLRTVSFYLEVDPPFTFNNPSNKDIYNNEYRRLTGEGIKNKTAKRNAAKVFGNKNKGSRGTVPMTATLVRKSRRANRRKGTRRRASRGR